MKPEEKLKQIEDQLSYPYPKLILGNMIWLIARVKKLTVALLEYAAECEGCSKEEPCVALKALEED